MSFFRDLLIWNDWYNDFIYVTDPSLFSFQNALNRIMSNIQFLACNSSFRSRASEAVAKITCETFRMAIAVVRVIPILIAYPFFQKYFLKGMTIGAVKSKKVR